jgi:GT2 family glycosyltransferase
MLPETICGQRVAVELTSGSCFMVKKSLFESLGGFDSGTFLYYEENILWEKIRRRGLKNYLDCSVRLIHLGAATTSTQVKSIFVAKCLVDSTRYFIRHFTNAGVLYRAAIAPFYGLFMLKIRLKSLIKR